MTELLTLARRDGSEELGFQSLKREGLRLVQEFSGAIWTDYNLHDPGVTILDQLCYALMELCYRAQFPVEDFLAAPDGSIEPEEKALHLPEEILPSRPTTRADLRQVIFAEVGEIDDVWVEVAPEAEPRGLLRVAVQLQDSVPPEAADGVVEKVRKACCRVRNLCEDVAEITVAPELVCELHAQIELHEETEPAEVVARIYHECSMKVIDVFSFTPFSEAHREGESLERILRGPLVVYGVVPEAELLDRAEAVRIAELFSLIRSIPGVAQIRELYLSCDGHRYYDYLGAPGRTMALRLRIPETAADVGVKVTRSDREIAVPVADIRAKYGQLYFRHRSMRRAQHDLSMLRPEPRGTWRQFDEYYSIQNGFPANYGVNAMGLPASAPAELRGKVAQLKGYLLLFEQVLANYTADLAHLGHLFSARNGGKCSYAHRIVENDGSPPLRELYAGDGEAAVAATVARRDPFADRGNRVLDYLLALHGETFPQESFRHFDWYARPGTEEGRLMAGKSSFLRAIVAAGRDRGAGLDYSLPAAASRTGMEVRVGLLLRFREDRPASLTAAIAREGLRLVSSAELLSTLPLLFDAPGGGGSDSWEEAPLAPARMISDAGIVRREAALIQPTSQGLLAEPLLQRGIDLGNFRVADADGAFRLLFTPDAGASWWCLAGYSSLVQAFRGASLLSRFLTGLNEESEGMYVVEHILLRPLGTAGWRDGENRDDDFYSLRASVVFPGWTARCSDAGFRQMAEDLVVENCPAHVFPTFYWLGYGEMAEFEDLYLRWLDAIRAPKGETSGRDRAAALLVDFLRQKDANL